MPDFLNAAFNNSLEWFNFGAVAFDFATGKALRKLPGSADLQTGLDVSALLTTTTPSKRARDRHGRLGTLAANTLQPFYNNRGERIGIIAEGARTNALTNSETLADMSLSEATKAAASNVFLDGVAVYKLTESTANAPHYIYQARGTFTGGSYVTSSVFLREGERRYCQVAVTDGTNSAAAIIDLRTGSVLSTTGVAGAWCVEAYTDGFFRVSRPLLTDAAATSVNLAVYIHNDSQVQSYTGDGLSGIYIGKIQSEVGVNASSYIPTAGSPVARAADAIDFPAASMLALGFNDWEGALVAEGFALSGANLLAQLREVTDTANAHFIYVSINATATTQTAGADSTNAALSATFSTAASAGSFSPGGLIRCGYRFDNHRRAVVGRPSHTPGTDGTTRSQVAIATPGPLRLGPASSLSDAPLCISRVAVMNRSLISQGLTNFWATPE